MNTMFSGLRQLFSVFLVLFFVQIHAQNNSRVITTGVPFLLITPDARAAGMGELGVATSADVYAQQWNPSKYVFAKNITGVGISYTPYLSKLVDDIFLANITYYKQNSDRSAWGTSLKYFSLGDIQFNDLIGGNIIQQGVERPNELTLDISYGLKLNDHFSLSVAGRFIRSDLKLSTDVDATAATTLGVDISGFYRGDRFDFMDLESRIRYGFNISNIGPRLKYDEGGHYVYHTDFFHLHPRQFSLILLLNNDYKGGELVFNNPKFDEEYKIETKPGRLIVWPSNFLFPHKVNEVVGGKRYSIVGWSH